MGDINYRIDADNEDLQWWNYDLNHEDIIHDAENIKELQKNQLFQQCLSEILTEELSTEEIQMDEDEDEVYWNPIKIPKASKKRPIQLSNVDHIIHDTYSGKKIGIPDKITPSYYFDPASRSYTKPEVARNLNTFLTTNGLLNTPNTPVDLTKYGFTDTTITMKFAKIQKWNYLVVTVKTPDDSFDIKITLNKGEYDPEDPSFPYLGGNEDKAKFFRTYATKSQDRILVIHGKRFILCKLLGDLMHAVFASSGDSVFTNDSYLRDRCIKNKVDVIHREICKKGMIDCKDEFHTAKQKEVLVRMLRVKNRNKISKKELKTKPKKFNQTSIYYYYPTNFQSGAGSKKQISGSKYNTFQNESNKQNLLNYINSYIGKLNDFMSISSFIMYGNKVDCPDNVKTYIQNLITYLSGNCKKAIIITNTVMEVDDYNKELTKWFPQDILYSSEDMTSEIRPIQTKYYSPTSIRVVFPYNKDVPNELNYFTSEKASFDLFVAPELKKTEMSPYTLNDILGYFDKKLNSIEQPDTSDIYLLGSEELNNAIEIINKIKNNSELQNNDDFLILINNLLDSSFTTEDDLLKAYLMVICGNDEIKAYTIYTSLLPLTYFNGFNIYDYEILTTFVKKLGVNESLPGGYAEFMRIVSGSEEPETVFPTMKTGMNISEMEIDKRIEKPLMIGSEKKKKYSRKKSNSKTTNNKIKIHGNRKTHKKKYTRRNKKI